MSSVVIEGEADDNDLELLRKIWKRRRGLDLHCERHYINVAGLFDDHKSLQDI